MIQLLYLGAFMSSWRETRVVPSAAAVGIDATAAVFAKASTLERDFQPFEGPPTSCRRERHAVCVDFRWGESSPRQYCSPNMRFSTA